MEAYSENLKNAWNRILTKFFAGPAESADQDEPRSKSPRFQEFEWHLDLQRMKKLLRANVPYTSEDSGTPEAFVHLNLMKSIHRYLSLDEAGFRDVVQGMSRVHQLLRGNGTNFNWQKWLPLASVEIVMPNTLGFLVTTRVQAQIFTSFKGNVKIVAGDLLSDFSAKPPSGDGDGEGEGDETSQASGPSFNHPAVEVNIKPT